MNRETTFSELREIADKMNTTLEELEYKLICEMNIIIRDLNSEIERLKNGN